MINKQRQHIQVSVIDAFKKHEYNGASLVPTGTGKAWIFIQILKALKPKTCWYLCDSERNRDITFKNELIKWGAEKWIDKIEFMCYQTAFKCKGEKVDLLLADEFDYSLSPEYSKVYKNNLFKHKILLSGTLSADKHKVLSDLKIPIVSRVEIEQVENAGALNKANYYIVNYLLSNNENEEYINYNRKFAKLLNSFYKRQDLEMLQIMRKHFMSNLASSVFVCRKVMTKLFNDPNNKILVFCGLSEQANKVSKQSYHSKTDDVAFKLFDEGKIRVLSVVAKADRGLNINGVNNIIFESPTKSSTKFFQRTGRGRRLKVNDILNVYFLIPYFIDLRGNVRPTIVHDWVFKAAEKLETFKPINYTF